MTMAGGVGGGPGTWNIYLIQLRFVSSLKTHTAPKKIEQLILQPSNMTSIPRKSIQPKDSVANKRVRIIHGFSILPAGTIRFWCALDFMGLDDFLCF